MMRPRRRCRLDFPQKVSRRISHQKQHRHRIHRAIPRLFLLTLLLLQAIQQLHRAIQPFLQAI